MGKIIGYARVSSVSQKWNNSFEYQEKVLKEKYGEDIEVYREQFTGKTLDRPIFNSIIEKLEADDIIACARLDRFARSTEEGIHIIKGLITKGVKVDILNIGLIDNSPIGIFTLTVLLAVAELERSMILERMEAGKEIARLDPNYREGRPEVFKKMQKEHAMLLLETYTYKQVSELTGMSVSTLQRYKRSKEYKKIT